MTVLPLVAPRFSHATVSNVSFRVGMKATAIAVRAPVGTGFRFDRPVAGAMVY